jgi:hypothetical protein
VVRLVLKKYRSLLEIPEVFLFHHWWQVEEGRPITVTTQLRICEVFELSISKLVQGLDAEGVYEKQKPVLPLRRRS